MKVRKNTKNMAINKLELDNFPPILFIRFEYFMLLFDNSDIYCKAFTVYKITAECFSSGFLKD